VLANYWCWWGFGGEAHIVVVVCGEVEATDVGCVEPVVLGCNDWWRDWAGKAVGVYVLAAIYLYLKTAIF